jgi:hypothetical protein
MKSSSQNDYTNTRDARFSRERNKTLVIVDAGN